MAKKENPVDVAIALCAEQVRREDYPRYAMTLLMKRAARPALWALFAFHLELKKIPGQVREPMMGLIRFQWWRDAIADVFAGQVAHHPVLRSLGSIDADRWRESDFQALVDAHEDAFRATAPLTLPQIVAQCDAIGLALQNLAYRGQVDREAATTIGGAYELAQCLPDIPRLWVHGKMIDDSLDMAEIERVRLSQPELEKRLRPFMRHMASIMLSRVADAYPENPILALSASVTRRRIAALQRHDFNVFARNPNDADHLLPLYLLLEKWGHLLRWRRN